LQPIPSNKLFYYLITFHEEIEHNLVCPSLDAAADTTSQSDDRFKPHDQFQPIGKLYKRSHRVSANSKKNALYSGNNMTYNT